MIRLRLLLPLVAVSSPAWALEPAKHRELAERACFEQQLPEAFCRRVGHQAFETDFKEWEDLSAHAQREHGQDRCSAAEAAATRVSQLGTAIVDGAAIEDYDQVAIALGRALHTMQDECSHHGITNEEHAYYSLTETCGDGDVSPDSQPEAIQCAEARTREVMAFVAEALRETSWRDIQFVCRNDNNEDSCANPTLPGLVTACRFLHAHREWDGIDSSWDTVEVGAELVTSFHEALQGFGRSRTLCGDDPGAIDPAAPRARVADTTAGCKRIDAVCLGKVDDPGETDDADETGGCSTGHPSALLALALLTLVRRRRD
jgi:hypothetical protein